MIRYMRNIFIPFLILVGAIFLFLYLLKLKPKPVIVQRSEQTTIVSVTQFEPQQDTCIVQSNGTVRPSKIVNLMPELAGKVIKVSRDMGDGAFFKKGEILFWLDSSDYHLQLIRAKSRFITYKTQHTIEDARVEVAKKEWSDYKQNYPVDSSHSLTLREPQLELAKANLEAAKAEMEIAKLNLKRTLIRAPFNGRVRKKKVDIGQFVSPGMVMAVLYDTEKAIVTVPLQKEEIELLDLENGYNNSSKNRNRVAISSNFGLKEYSWYGRYVRDEAEFNLSNRLLNLIVEVNEPYSPEWEKPLRPGMYVTVRIKGKQLRDVYKIPRDFFYNESLLKIYNNGKLELREVKSILVNKDYVYIDQGLHKDDLVITSRMDEVVEGMKVKIGAQ